MAERQRAAVRLPAHGAERGLALGAHREVAVALGLSLALCAQLSCTQVARAADPPLPAWPVPNPSFEREGFRPTSEARQLSGVFGPRLKWGDARYDHHEGFDFHAFFAGGPEDGRHEVRAILPGVVSEVVDPPDPERLETGRKVVVTHDVAWSAFGAPAAWGPVKSGYLHLSRIGVRAGERVERGEAIGSAGESGHTTTVHLHLNVYRSSGRGRDVNVNPARLFSPRRFPAAVAPLEERTAQVEWLERDVEQGTVLVRVSLPWNAYTLDGFVLEVNGDASRALSFEQVSAERERRDRGDVDLIPGLKLYPALYNGGGAAGRLNGRERLPEAWPARRFPIVGDGPRLVFDLLGTGVPRDARDVRLRVRGVEGEDLLVSVRRDGTGAPGRR
jgi:murein DD-endopeptidase MepM/ murein hydrolase activator NlpD